MTAAPEPVVTIIRPQLTPEEYERRMQKIKQSVSAFWLAVERRRHEKGNEVHGVSV